MATLLGGVWHPRLAGNTIPRALRLRHSEDVAVMYDSSWATPSFLPPRFVSTAPDDYRHTYRSLSISLLWITQALPEAEAMGTVRSRLGGRVRSFEVGQACLQPAPAEVATAGRDPRRTFAWQPAPMLALVAASGKGRSVHPGGNGDHLVLARQREALSGQQTLAVPPLRRVARRVTLLS